MINTLREKKAGQLPLQKVDNALLKKTPHYFKKKNRETNKNNVVLVI